MLYCDKRYSFGHVLLSFEVILKKKIGNLFNILKNTSELHKKIILYTMTSLDINEGYYDIQTNDMHFPLFLQ